MTGVYVTSPTDDEEITFLIPGSEPHSYEITQDESKIKPFVGKVAAENAISAWEKENPGASYKFKIDRQYGKLLDDLTAQFLKDLE